MSFDTSSTWLPLTSAGVVSIRTPMEPFGNPPAPPAPSLTTFRTISGVAPAFGAPPGFTRTTTESAPFAGPTSTLSRIITAEPFATSIADSPPAMPFTVKPDSSVPAPTVPGTSTALMAAPSITLAFTDGSRVQPALSWPPRRLTPSTIVTGSA